MNLLKKIFSIRYKGVHKIITILGIQLKIKLKRELLELHALKNIEFDTAYWNWITYGTTKELISRLSYLSISPEQWKLQNNKLWLIYISCLIETNDFDMALSIMQKYINKYGYEDIEKYLLVAAFAYENGYENETFAKAQSVLKKLEQSKINKPFEELIKGKTVAIVGNGPSEIGKGKGKEIDSHDIVIRINNYQIHGFEEDYGTKTDIWVKCSSNDIKHDVRDKNISLIVYEPDYYHHPIFKDYLDAIYDSEYPVDFLDFNDHIDLRNNLKIFPSTGLVIVEKVRSLPVKSVNCYGFSFQQEKEKGFATHYFNDRSEKEARKRSKHHSFKIESEYLRTLFIEQNNICKEVKSEKIIRTKSVYQKV